jgi:hypothetical protein
MIYIRKFLNGQKLPYALPCALLILIQHTLPLSLGWMFVASTAFLVLYGLKFADKDYHTPADLARLILYFVYNTLLLFSADNPENRTYLLLLLTTAVLILVSYFFSWLFLQKKAIKAPYFLLLMLLLYTAVYVGLLQFFSK